jgi:hypothetical protein
MQPGAASGLNVVGTLKELGIRVFLYGCDVVRAFRACGYVLPYCTSFAVQRHLAL